MENDFLQCFIVFDAENRKLRSRKLSRKIRYEKRSKLRDVENIVNFPFRREFEAVSELAYLFSDFKRSVAPVVEFVRGRLCFNAFCVQ